MEKLVLTYNTGDGYTFNGSATIPFEYESLNKASEDLLSAAEKVKIERLEYDEWLKIHTPYSHPRNRNEKRDQDYIEWFHQEHQKRYKTDHFVFLGTTYHWSEVDALEMNIETLDQWFSKNKES